MPSDIDREQWSGEGDFTQTLVDWLIGLSAVTYLRVEDSPSTRNDVEYNFISNEIFVRFQTVERVERYRPWGVLPWSWSRSVAEKAMTLEQLESALVADDDIESPDYADEGLIQFLHTERIIPPYQTKGYKLVELVRLYEVGTSSRVTDDG